ncbi:MAG TPA: OB-fold domain-containing protein [Streptosporangiaceae bacterium]|nr:OB-fold domain-containing protein [Streptosporangiaceae bacterium]
MNQPITSQHLTSQHLTSQPLHAPLEISFGYTRSLGPTLGAFMTGLASRRILGARASDGLVHAPPFEYDPVTGTPPGDFVEVGPGGTVLTWSWMPRPISGQPLGHPFGWALIRLDGADTAMLHAVDAGSAKRMRTGMRVRPRWSASRGRGIFDIECFEPGEPEDTRAEPGQPQDASAEPASPVTMVTTPISLSYDHTVSPGEDRFLRGLAEGKLIAQRCPACGKVYLPPRGACPVDGVPTRTEVELPDTGIVTTFCVVNVPFQGQQVPTPYVAASVLIDGADIAVQHLILGCEPDEVKMGMRVRAVWKPREEWTTSMRNIDHFEPTGEPDAPYDTYAHHL